MEYSLFTYKDGSSRHKVPDHVKKGLFYAVDYTTVPHRVKRTQYYKDFLADPDAVVYTSGLIIATIEVIQTYPGRLTYKIWDDRSESYYDRYIPTAHWTPVWFYNSGVAKYLSNTVHLGVVYKPHVRLKPKMVWVPSQHLDKVGMYWPYK